MVAKLKIIPLILKSIKKICRMLIFPFFIIFQQLQFIQFNVKKKKQQKDFILPCFQSEKQKMMSSSSQYSFVISLVVLLTKRKINKSKHFPSNKRDVHKKSCDTNRIIEISCVGLVKRTVHFFHRILQKPFTLYKTLHFSV